MFALFAGADYYPAGGMDDLVGTFATVEEAQARFLGGYDYDWAHIVDTTTFAKVLVWATVTPGKRASKTRPAQLEIWGWIAP